MSIQCLCDKYNKLKLCGISNIKSTTHGVINLKQKICGTASLKPRNGIMLGTIARVCASSNINSFANSEMVPSKYDCQENSNIKANITLPELSIRAKLLSDSSFSNKYTDKFAGEFTSLRKIKNFIAQQKLYPSGDIISSGFINEKIQSENLFSSINEGVFTGNYIEHGNASYIISDNNSTYIQPSSITTQGSFFYQCAVDPALIKTKNSYLFMRAAVPLQNYASNTSPEVHIYNILLEDPSGNLIVKYKDLVFRGDADFSVYKNIKNYATYITEPEINNGGLYEWQSKFPIYENRHGYKLSFNVDVLCLDDPFDNGFNKGYEEFVCDTSHLNSIIGDNDYLAIDGSPISTQQQGQFNPTNNLRISAIEICNSGYNRHALEFAPFKEKFLGLSTAVQPEGYKIIKQIFPTRVMPHNFNTTIYPDIDTTWESDNTYHKNIISNLTQNISSGLYLGSQISDRSLSTWIHLNNSTIEDSGKLIVKFEDQARTTTSFYQGRDFAPGEFNINFNRSRTIYTKIDDAYYSNISKIELIVNARKAINSRDYALDVVGYSNDKILFVTSPVGGFLQNLEDGIVINQNIISSSIMPPDDLGLSSEAISDKSDTILYSNSIMNSGGDHYILTQSPLIDSILFKEYRIPLKIYDIIPDLGAIEKFNYSPYFEHLYLDIYPIPSGAEISDIRLEIEYSPQNSIHMHTIGVSRNEELYPSNMTLDIIPDAIHEHPRNYELNNLDIPYRYGLYDSTNLIILDNLSRRWRGVSGHNFNAPFDRSFGLSFSKDYTNHPFPSGYFDITNYTDTSLSSLNSNLSCNFVGLSTDDIYKNIGWRFNSNLLYTNQKLNYRTIQWYNENHHPVYCGTLTDSFDSAIRVSGVSKHLNIENINFDNGLSVFIRFSPDEISDSNNHMFNDGIIISKYNNGNVLEFAIGYKNGLLTAYSTDKDNNLITIQDTVAFDSWQYPLSVLLTYNNADKKLRLYADNEKADFENTPLLRCESNPFDKINTTQNITIGYSSGFNLGCSAFITEFGFSNRAITDDILNITSIEDNLIHYRTYGNVEDIFASIRQTANISLKNKLWDYLNSNISLNWKLGEFKHCQFDNSFSRLSYRNDEDFIEHRLIHNGLPYSSITDIAMPQLLDASKLSYHTQIENDFLRFNIEDVPETSGKFYAAWPRICKTLPRGYKFTEEAITVDTIIEHITESSIQWDSGEIGPKLIVSLYSPKLVPSYDGADKTLGLINRHIHYLKPSGCIHKISSTFDYNNLLDESEAWALFNRNKEHIIKEFDHKYFSSDINDMFLQYDLVYPSGRPFDSTIRLHAAEIRLKDCLRHLPSLNDSMNLFASGEFSQIEHLNFNTFGLQIVNNIPSGLILYVDGFFPPSISGIINLSTSGAFYPTETLNLYTNSHKTISLMPQQDNQFGALFGDNNNFGFFLNVLGGGYTENLNLLSYNDEVIDIPSGVLNLSLFNSTKLNKPIGTDLNFTIYVDDFIDYGRVSSEGMNLTLYKKDVFLAKSKTFNLFTYCELTPPDVVSQTLGLYTINYPPFDTEFTQQQIIQWNGKNIGTAILVTDNDYLSVDSDDEIRGVTTICYGDCDITGTCTNPPIRTHGIDWRMNDCYTGGVVRAKDTYTNLDVGYNHNYYGARKYGGLIPSYPYVINMRGYSGSNELVELPRIIETIEYGSNNNVNFSGIKLFTEDPFALYAQYGKSIVTKGDLLAIGAPNYILYDNEKELDKSGAVFLYRRLPAPSGYDWSMQQDKSGWHLEQILTLPSGYYRDYYHTSYKDVQGVLSTVRQWDIGNYGRKFGHSIDISVNEQTGKEIILVGAPQGKFDREFTEITTTDIKIGVIVITDEFSGFTTDNNISATKLISDLIKNYNDYFILFSNPSFKVDIDVIVIEPNKNVPFHEFVNYLNDSNYIHRFEITRLLRGEDVSIATNRIKQELISIFDTIYPLDNGVKNNNLPVMLGVIVDESASCGRRILPGLNEFLEYYKEYSFSNGLKNWDGTSASGIVVDVAFDRANQEDWISLTTQNINYSLSKDNIQNYLDVFTSGFGVFYASEDYRFNEFPPSGGRVYLFEKEPYTSGLLNNSNGESWYITQQFGLDLYTYDSFSINEGFGFSLSVSDNMENIAIGSPYSKTRGATVYELTNFSNSRMIEDNIVPWLNAKIAEISLLENNSISIYTLLYREYQRLKLTGLSNFGASKAIYDSLSESYRFDLLNYAQRKNKYNKYIETFKYHNDYNYTGSYDIYPKKFAGHPRVGYSIDLNEDGTILAIGCPTDSMNQWDDTNVWYRNSKQCDEEKNALGQDTYGGYQSSYESESHLQTNLIQSAGHEGTWSSYVNAGAVQVFNGRKYYPHNKVVEYGIFGNAHELYHAPESVINNERRHEFNIVSGVFSNLHNIPFIKTDFIDPEIPDDAGLLFILCPSQDSLSEEVLDNIKTWLSYGDRNLVLIGDDPIFEANGIYEETNRIINKLLDKLGSRVRIYPTNSTEYSQINPELKQNVIPATVPHGSIDTNVAATFLSASGVGDIRFYDRSIKYYHHSCDTDEINNLINQADINIDLTKYTYATANIGCEQPIMHEGDLRAQWYAWCADKFGVYHRVPRNIPAAYGAIPGLVEPLCDQGHICYKPPTCLFASRNQDVAPRPILAIGQQPESYSLIKKGTPEQINRTRIKIGEEPDPTQNTLRLLDPIDPIFNWNPIIGSVEYSGNYISEPILNYGNNLWTNGDQFFKPEDTDRPFILQGRDSKLVKDITVNIHASDWTNIVAEEAFSENNTSSIVLISCVSSEAKDVLFTGNDDAILFYRNLLTKNNQIFNSNNIDFEADPVNVAQLGGWTKRTSFVDGYHDSFIYTKNEAGSEDGLVSINTLFFHIKNIDLNITSDELLNGRNGLKHSNYDICWIANTKHLPSDIELEKLKSWLRKGNKKLIITYAHDPELNHIDIETPSQIIADNTSQLCNKLGLSMKPLYLNGHGRYAELGRDSYTKEGVRSQDQILPQFNQNHYLSFITNSESLQQFKFYKTKPSVFSVANFDNFTQTRIIPIELNDATRVASIIGEFTPPSHKNSIADITRSNKNYHYNNSGFAKVSFELPTQNSGYFIKTGWYAQSPLEQKSTISIYATNLNDTYVGQKDVTPQTITIYGSNGVFQDNVKILDNAIGVRATKQVASNYTEIVLGPYYAHGSITDVYITSNNLSLKELGNNESAPYTPKLAFVSGYSVPIIEVKGFKDVFDFVETTIPATPDKEITIQPPLRELGSNHYKYCPDQLPDGCLNDFDKPLNQRGGLQQPGWEAELLYGDNIVTKDGPVVVTQEIELFSPFTSGFKRSRITVISDASMLQGSGIINNDGSINNNLISFISSLYPYTDFTSVENKGKVYSIRNKIVAPERGSPYKWYSVLGDNYLISRFNPNNNTINRLPMSEFVGNESEYDPTYVHRPLYSWECNNSPPVPDVEILKQQLLNAFGNNLHNNISTQFSGIIDNKAYGDDLSLYQEKGYDFLDFEYFPDGYPGDLFGYAVKLQGNKLFVGSPFSAYYQESGIVKWDQIANTTLYETPSGVILSAFGGAGAVYMFENNNNGTSSIRNEISPWAYIRKFRPDSINAGQDYINIATTQEASELGSNSYSTFDVSQYSKTTDRFGYSIDIADGILAIGAPGHDFGNFVEEDPRLGLFMNKAFGNAFDIRHRTVYDLGSSNVRTQLPNSGIAILNNGAVYIYTEDYDFVQKKNYWHKLEKIIPQGYNSYKQKYYDGSIPIAVSGSENSHFGSSVSVARRNRTDTNYTVAIGSQYHPFTNNDDYYTNHGASYTYDLMLRRPQPASRSNQTYISGRIFGHSGVAYNTEEFQNEIKFYIQNNQNDSLQYTESGILFTNPRGEIFIEVSGQDPSIYGLIQHRPFIESIDGVILSGTKYTNALRLFVEGRPQESSGTMNLSVHAANSAFVYNNIGLYNFGVDGVIYNSGLNLITELESAPIENSGMLYLFASGVGLEINNMNLRIRGY